MWNERFPFILQIIFGSMFNIYHWHSDFMLRHYGFRDFWYCSRDFWCCICESLVPLTKWWLNVENAVRYVEASRWLLVIRLWYLNLILNNLLKSVSHTYIWPNTATFFNALTITFGYFPSETRLQKFIWKYISSQSLWKVRFSYIRVRAFFDIA